MPAKPVLIGDRLYLRKKDALAAVQAVRNRYKPGERVSDPEDEAFLHDLLDKHYDADQKRGAGIDHFQVRRTTKGSVGFHIIRTDGSDTDFSFMVCLDGEPSQRQNLLATMRDAVKWQVIAVKNKAFEEAGEERLVTCALTGDLVAEDEVHVDHFDPDFIDLATHYVSAQGGWDAFPLLNGLDNTVGSVFADDTQREAWESYHQEHANLRVISIQANLSLRRRGVRRKTV